MSDLCRQRLDGWKAIAAYLGRDVRTAQRWHARRGMPVHRVPGGGHASVFADTQELDDWMTAPVKLSGGVTRALLVARTLDGGSYRRN